MKLYAISLPEFNLPLVGSSTWLTPPGPYRATTCRGRELNFGSYTNCFDHTMTWRASQMSDQLNSGSTSETTQTWKTIHTRHTLIHSNKANMEWWLWRPNEIRGSWGPKASWHLSYRWGKAPEKNLTQETCPDWESNLGLLRGRRACYRLFHSGGHEITLKLNN